MDMEDPFGPLPSTMAQSSASTSYTIMSPRAFSSSPLPPNLLSQKGSPAAVPTQEGGPKSASSNSPLTSSRPAGHPAFTTGTPLTTNMNVTSPSTIIRAVSPPTPAPSPQPDLGTHVHSTGPIASNATPSHPASILMAHSGSAAMGEPGTPVSPGTEDAQGLAWGDPNMHVHPSHFGEQDQAFHIDPEVQEAIFAEQFIQSVVSYFPRLTGPERRTLFTSLLPQMSGEDLLHLSNLISPYLRRDFLAELPAEISLKILGFIDDPKDLMRASRVSRTWRSLVADEHNWKLMLDKYNGGGWSEARPALAPSSVGLTNAPVGQFTSQGRSRGEAALSTGNVPSQRLANIAQASRSRVQEYRPSSYTAQNSFTGAQLPSAGKTLQPVEPEYEEEENVNRFLPENQTPLAGRTKKNKGKGRASDGNLDALASNRDLTAPGFSSAGMPGPSTSSSIVGLMPAMQQTPFDSNSTASVGSLHGLGVLPPRRGHSSMPYQTSPSAASVLASQQQQRSPAGRAMPGSYRPGPPLIFSRSHSAAPPQIAMPYPPPPQNLTSQLQQLSLASSAPNLLRTLSIPASTLSETQSASSQLNSSIASSAVSPSATFALAYASPAQFVTPVHASSGSSLDASGTPSVITSDQLSLVASQRAHGQSEQHSQSAPQPARVRIAKSQNPFGTAQTNLSYTSQYSQNMQFSSNSTSSTSKPFSFKTQFKKAYLTESNWLKGPGRVLSRQTCTDDGVVTSLGFDNEWIIVGMATNQIHVFDAKTGAYVQQLVGHTLGVWCLVLVSKGGHKLDKEGKRVKSPKTDVEGMPSIFQTPGRTSWEAASDDDESSSSDDEEDGKERASPTMTRSSSTGFLRTDGMERTRSASARPADRETFFQEASESFISSPYLGVNDGSPQGRGNNKSTSQPRRPSSSGMPSSEPSKRRRSNKRPSSFCGVPSSDPSSSAQDGSSSSSAKFTSNPSGFPFGGNGTNISPQQAAACGTAQGWGQPGAVAVSGGCDRDVRVWDVATGVCIHVLRGHLSTVRCLKVLDGRPIAVSGSRDNTLRVWDIERGVLLKLLSGHHHSVRCIEISGNKVVSGSYDATCKIWDVDTGECLHTLQGHQHQIYAVAFDGNRVASGSLDSTVRIWSAKTGECLALLQGHTSLVGQLQLTDSLLVTGGSDGRVIVFSLSTFECLHRLCAHDNSVTCLQFNDRFMVTGGNDGRVKLWDRPTGKLIRDLAEPCEAVWRVTFREDKCVLLCKRGNRTIMEVRTFAPFDEEL